MSDLADRPSSRRQGDWPPIWLLAMAAVLLAAVLLTPGYLAVRAAESGPDLWAEVFQARTATTLLRTLVLGGVVTLGAIVLGVPLAWLTVRTNLPGRRVWSVLTALPLAIPSYVGAMVVVVTLGPRGSLQWFLEPFTGIDRLPEIYGLPGAALTLILLSYPYVMLSVRAALWGLDPSLEEASRSLGRGPWSTFVRVVWPQLVPAVCAGGLLTALYTLSEFGAVKLLRYPSFTFVIYTQYESSFNHHLAAGLSLILVVLTVGVLLLEGLARQRARLHRGSAGASRVARPLELGHWHWPALGLCATVVGLAVGAPVLVLLDWLLRGLIQGEPLRLVAEPAINSLAFSGLAALLTVMAALPVAVLAVRYPGWWAAIIERGVYLGYGLPGIVVALGLVFFSLRYMPAWYQRLPLLIFAYLVLFLPQAVGPIKTSLLQVRPSLEEAARGLGRPLWSVWWSITLPLLRPGCIAAAALVFLSVMKELPATLILSPTGVRTLATQTWMASNDGFYARAAAPALFLVVCTMVPMSVLLWQERGMSR